MLIYLYVFFTFVRSRLKLKLFFVKYFTTNILSAIHICCFGMITLFVLRFRFFEVLLFDWNRLLNDEKKQ